MSEFIASGLGQNLCAWLALTLGHFLWQGAAVGLLTRAAARGLRSGRPLGRYNLYLAAMVVLGFCPIVTFILLARSPAQPVAPRELSEAKSLAPAAMVDRTANSTPAPANASVEMGPMASTGIPKPSAPQVNVSIPTPAAPTIAPDWHSYAGHIVAFYLIGVTFMIVRTIIGLQNAHVLRRQAAAVTSPELLGLLKDRARLLGLRFLPPLATSARVTVPCLIGVLRPVILLPTTILTGLSTEQIGVILAHELSHLRRHDHWISLLQRLIEAALFFHPAVWFISKRLSTEREICCDELVVAQGGSRSGYAQVLLAVAELCRPAPAVALAATGRPSELRMRVARLLSDPNGEFVPQKRWMTALLLPTVVATIIVSMIAVTASWAQTTPERVVFEDSFTAQIKPNWSAKTVQISTTPAGAKPFLGPFGSEAVSLDLSDLGEHQFVRVSVDMLAIRTWDGNHATRGPDLFCIYTDDGRILHCTSLGWYGPQAFPGFFSVNTAPPGAGARAAGEHGFEHLSEIRDGIFRIECVFPHRQSKLGLRFVAGLDSDTSDEAWGIANVRVTLDGISAPSASDLDAAWDQLGSDDPAAAASAVWRIVEGADRSVGVLNEKLRNTTIPANLELLDPSQSHVRSIPATQDTRDPYALHDPAQRRVALAAHALQVIGSESARGLLARRAALAPPADAAPELHRVTFALKDRTDGQPVAHLPMNTLVPAAFLRSTVITSAQGLAMLDLPAPIVRSTSLAMTRASKYVPLRWSGRASMSDEKPPERVELVLERGNAVNGVVVDDAGQPVEGATVVFWMMNNAAPNPTIDLNLGFMGVQTNTAGRWSVDVLPAQFDSGRIGVYHRNHLVGLGNNGYDAFYPLYDFKSLDELREGKVKLILRRGVPVAGVVTSAEDGKPLSGVRVALGSMRTGSNAMPTHNTDAQGRFGYAGEPGKTVYLTASKEGYVPQARQIEVEAQPKPVDFVLERGQTLTGHVVDPEGKPVSGVTLAIDLFSQEIRRTTDSEGNFRVNGVPAGNIYAEVMRDGYVRRGFSLNLAQENVITIQPSTRFTATVVDDQTGEPIKAFQIITGRIDKDNEGRARWTRRPPSDPYGQGKDGQFSLSFTWPAEAVLVKVEAAGYLPLPSPPIAMDGKSHSYEYRMRRGEDVKGVVLDGQGKPVPDANVIMVIPGESLQLANASLDEVSRESVTTRTGADGRFSLPPQTGDYGVLVLHESGTARVAAFDLNRTAGAVILEPWAKIEAVVTSGGEPNSGARVSLNSTEDAGPRAYFYYSGVADDQGKVRFDRVPARELQISAFIVTGPGRGRGTNGRSIGRTTVRPQAGETLAVPLSEP